MTSAQRSLPVCVCLLFPCSPRESRAEWGFTAAVCLFLTPQNCDSGRGWTHANASPGLTLDHAHAGEIGGGQFYGRCDGWWLQRWPSQRLGSAAKIPVQQTGVPGTVAGRDRVLGGSHCETHRHPEGDQAAAVVHRLRRVSNLCASIFSPTVRSIHREVSASFLDLQDHPPRCKQTHQRISVLLLCVLSWLLWQVIRK